MATYPALPLEIACADDCLHVLQPAKVVLIRPVLNPEIFYAELFNSYYHRVKQYAFIFYETKEDAEDTAQNVFMKLWERRDRLHLVTTMESYLFTMTRNRYINDLRSFRRNKKAVGYLKYKEESYANFTEEAVYLKETKGILDKSIKQLPSRMKLVFLLKQEGYKRKEISIKMGIHTNTVKHHLQTAVRRIESHLKII